MRNSTLYKNKPKTFRRSSAQIFGVYGSNLQNVEKDLRSIYIPDGFDYNSPVVIEKCKHYLETGDASVFTENELTNIRVFLQCDQSGAEALIVAYDCEPKDYRQLFIHGVKPHVYVALKLFPDVWRKKILQHKLDMEENDIDVLFYTPIPKLKLNPAWKSLDWLIKQSDNWALNERYYYFAKQTCHSANYGIEWATFIFNVLEKSGGKVVIPKNEGMRFLQTYRGLFNEIPDRCERVRRQVDRDKIIYNLFGHPYFITNETITEVTYKEYYAWLPQSTVGEITRTAYCSLQEYIESAHKQWDILADTHDSYMTQSPLTEAKDCGTRMKNFMNQEFTSPVDGVKFNMKSELQIGFNWGPYKKDKNELGLREVKWI